MSSPSNRDLDFSPLNAEIHKLRASGKPLEALRKLISVELNFGPRPGLQAAVKKLWGEHLFSGECLLLEAGREAARNEDPRTPSSELLLDFQRFDQTAGKLRASLSMFDWRSVESRSRLIQCRLANLSQDELSTELQSILNAYAGNWPSVQCDELSNVLPRNGVPNWLTRTGVVPQWQSLLHTLRPTDTGHHPAWHCLGEFVACLLRPNEAFSCEQESETWILLAESESPSGRPTSPQPQTPPSGVLAKLRIERIANGTGAVYPHPAQAGQLSIDEIFSASIQQALLAAIKLDREVAACDYRWSLWIVSEETNEADRFRNQRLKGPSAGLSFAAAIRAAALGEKLDLHVACTAGFLNRGPAQPQLGPVGQIGRKVSAKSFQVAHISELLVAHGQRVAVVEQPITAAVRSESWNLTLVPVEDLRTAYERMAKFPRITRAVKGYLQARSQRLLKFLCDPYERPSICRLKDVVDREVESENGPYERLDDAELKLLFAGQPTAKRIQLFADSGFGKSTLLVELEGTIAGTDGPLVPVRVGAGFADLPPGAEAPLHLPLLDDKLFLGTRQQVIKKLIQRLDWFADADSATHGLTIQERDLREWLQRKLECGEVVFLFDAADQTSQQPTGVASLLKACRNCAAIVSGRPETKQTKDQLWGAEQWHTLYSRGFDHDEWRRYFVADASAANRGRAESRANKIWENMDWRPLVRPPILAEQVKNLEREGKLRDSTSRYDLYTISLEQLVAKGLDTLNATPETRHREEDWEPADVMDSILSPLAWRMLQVELAESDDGMFRGQVAGQAYGKLKASRREELDPITFKVLWQIGVTIRMAILDQDGQKGPADSKRGTKRLTNKEFGGLSWRHLSFFEYFVGRAIAAKPEEFTALAERYARTPQWRWPFRFALSSLAADHRRSQDLATLAECLIKYGNPFVVYEAITLDHVKLDPKLHILCRSLVHHDLSRTFVRIRRWKYSCRN